MLVERTVNAPLRSTSGNSYFSRADQKNKVSPLSEVGSKAMDKLSGVSSRQSGRVLKIVVFVHGFQVLSFSLSCRPSKVSADIFNIFFLHDNATVAT